MTVAEAPDSYYLEVHCLDTEMGISPHRVGVFLISGWCEEGQHRWCNLHPAFETKQLDRKNHDVVTQITRLICVCPCGHRRAPKQLSLFAPMGGS